MTDTRTLREQIARVFYDELEGPIANQDFWRQMEQWERSLSLADRVLAILDAVEVSETPSHSHQADLAALEAHQEPDAAQTETVLLEIIEWCHIQKGNYPAWFDRARKAVGQFDGDAGTPPAAPAPGIADAPQQSDPDTAGLVERLRAATFTKGRVKGGICGQTIEASMRSTFHEVSAWDLEEAADALSALRAENERLTEAQDTLANHLAQALSKLLAAEAECDRLQAELGRVMDHLENVMGHVDTPIGRRRLQINDRQPEWLTDARAALTQPRQQPGQDGHDSPYLR